MPNYEAPGVYVEEVPPLARPIAGVGTSTAAFIGVADRLDPADVGKPKKFTNWTEFANFIKGAAPTDTTPIYTTANRTLALAVFGFFNNGGTACYVLPVAAGDMANLDPSLDKLKPFDEIAIVAAPGVEPVARKVQIMTHCFNMQDRVALLDGVKLPASDSTPADIYGGPMPVGGPATPDQFSYGAIYFPWLKVFNPLYVPGGAEPELIDQPPSGHVAGIWARVDAARGVHKAPANEAVLGIVDLERPIDKDKQKALNPDGINVIRPFGGAPMVYGARTLGGKRNGEYTYLNVRRFMNFLKESIDEGTQFVVFEPNNPALWQRIIRSVSDFLYNQWRDGALFGETPKQAFYVKCDAETNPPSLRELGQVITEIGVAVTKPAEFVIFRIQQTTGE
ncbi:phage tail sheath family protein [Variovorax sp. RA8]|uniref:phage tail sheath family protein n=1 Tax=Variovorax sp. (strain JCM 16519 / RA8) TaxID=662548 RepID=UPI0013175296|nr:phage tail sheath subtilisin-like domain-containing protein [Variovorax sp. RA8]VTU28844.1 major tail sheath protein [Variovorax sp. RA8]